MTQYARPDADPGSLGNWQLGCSAMEGDLYAQIDEASGGSDCIYVMDQDGSAESIQFGLSDVTDPEDHSNHKLSIHAFSDDSTENEAIVVQLVLKQGSTTISESDEFTLVYESDGVVDEPHVHELEEEEAEEITDYSDLYLVIIATDQEISMANGTHVNRAWFECPDAPAAGATTSPAFLLFM